MTATAAFGVAQDRRLSLLSRLGFYLTIAMVGAVVFFLVDGIRSGPVDWGGLVTGTTWSPASDTFGAAPMIWGTAVVSGIALVIAAPLGWTIAVATVALVSDRWARLATSWIQFLAVVPSVVWGLLAVAYVRPVVSVATGSVGGDSILAAGVVLAAMVLPVVTSVSIDALRAVSKPLLEAARCCGVSETAVVRSVLVPSASRGLAAGSLLGLSRALGETIAVYLAIGRVDGVLPRGVRDGLVAIARPGQTLTTKLNSPESLLAGTSGKYWATMCALALVLFLMTLGVGLVGARLSTLSRPTACCGPNRGSTGRVGAIKDRLTRVVLMTALSVGLILSVAVLIVVTLKGFGAISPSFFFDRAEGVSGGGVRDQGLGTLLLLITAALIACPAGCLAGLWSFRGFGKTAHPGPRLLALVLAGVPSIVLGLAAYGLLISRAGLGKSWLAGGVALAVVAIPYVIVAVSASVESAPPAQLLTASALGLSHEQTVRSVVFPWAKPALASGALLGLARAIGETAPLLFTATVFAGAQFPPASVADAPVMSLPTHLFTIVQDSSNPDAQRVAWATALFLLIAAQVMVFIAQTIERQAREEVQQ